MNNREFNNVTHKNNKVPGEKNIVAELFKKDGIILSSRIK